MRNWVKSLFAGLLTDEIKGLVTVGLSALLASQGALLWAYGVGFLRNSHPVFGWLIASAVGVGVLFLPSVALNVIQWRRARRTRNFVIVAEGHPMALHWGMGTQGDKPVMIVAGDFHITNLTAQNLGVPRTELIVSYWTWGVIPRRKRVAGIASVNVIQGRKQGRERLIWMIEPPVLKRGQTLRARPVIVDGLDHVNKGKWRDWIYRGD